MLLGFSPFIFQLEKWSHWSDTTTTRGERERRREWKRIKNFFSHTRFFLFIISSSDKHRLQHEQTHCVSCEIIGWRCIRDTTRWNALQKTFWPFALVNSAHNCLARLAHSNNGRISKPLECVEGVNYTIFGQLLIDIAVHIADEIR